MDAGQTLIASPMNILYHAWHAAIYSLRKLAYLTLMSWAFLADLCLALGMKLGIPAMHAKWMAAGAVTVLYLAIASHRVAALGGFSSSNSSNIFQRIVTHNASNSSSYKPLLVFETSIRVELSIWSATSAFYKAILLAMMAGLTTMVALIRIIMICIIDVGLIIPWM